MTVICVPPPNLKHCDTASNKNTLSAPPPLTHAHLQLQGRPEAQPPCHWWWLGRWVVKSVHPEYLEFQIHEGFSFHPLLFMGRKWRDLL